MKTRILFLLVVIALGDAFAQGSITLNPIPVTNGVTGVLADSSIIAAVYYGPSGASEDGLMPLPPPKALVNGYAEFGTHTSVPGFAVGESAWLQVRAWTSMFPTYEEAVLSGQSSALAGKSLMFAVLLGGSPNPPPVPELLSIPGFTIYPVPEPTTTGLIISGFLFWGALGAGLAGKSNAVQS